MSRHIDKDVKEMTLPELRQEVMRFRIAFRKELGSTGNRRCWVNLLKELPEGQSIKPLSLSREVFLANCAWYYERNQPKPKFVKLELVKK